MLGGRRMVALDALLVCWGLGTWLGVNGVYLQLPLLVERLPEGWALPASMVLAVQLGNVGVLVYAALRRARPKASDSPYIYALLMIGTMALVINAFVYDRTTWLAGSETSLAFLALTFFVALVGCTSSVVFYPYLRHFRDMYLATYLVGEGLSGFIPSILALIQGVGGEPTCVPGQAPLYPPPRFDSMVFLLILGGLSAASLVSFTVIDRSKKFDSERVSPAAVTKDQEAEPQVALFRGRWLGVLVLMASLSALGNGVMPSVQSYSCMPYGTQAYHLAATLSAMANPAACLAGVWLRLAPPRLLAALLGATMLPLAHILATALLSPDPPLQYEPIGVAIIVISWVWVNGVVSYARMWVYVWAREGGARGMRVVGGIGQVGSASGSLLLFLLVHYTDIFTQAEVYCISTRDVMLLQELVVAFFVSKRISLLTAFVCWTSDELVTFQEASSAAGLRVRVVPQLSRPPLLPPDHVRREGALLDTLCPHADVVLTRQASSSRAFNLRYTWLLLQNSSLDLLSSTEILPDADVTWATSDRLMDVYRTKTAQPLILTDWGLGVDQNVTSAGLEEFWNRQPTAVARRKDLRNVRLKCELIVSQPQHFKGWSDLSARQIDTFPKLTYPIMMLLAEDLHFRYNMRQVDLYGEQHNGSFDGLAGSLQRGQVDLGGASVFMRADRWRILHYIAETIELRGAFIFRQPVQAAVSNVFLLPFSRGVWAVSAGLVLAAALLLAGLASVLHTHDPALRRITPAETFTFAVGTICQQGFHVTPSLISARLVMFSTLLLALFAFTAYSAKVVSILQSPSDALRTIDDLLHSSIAVGVQDTTYKKVYFAESSDPATQRLYRKKLLPLGERAYLSVVDGIARVRTEFFAFQVEESAGYDIISKTFTEREKCGLKQIQAFKLPMVAIPVKKHSGYRELIAVRVRWQREVGLMERTRRVWMAGRPVCGAGAGGFASVTVQDVLPCIQVLGLGCLISAFLLAAECLVYKLKKQS